MASREEKEELQPIDDLHHVRNIDNERPLDARQWFVMSDLVIEHIKVRVGRVVILFASIGDALTQRLRIAVTIEDRQRNAVALGKVVKTFAIRLLQERRVDDDAVAGMQDIARDFCQS
jgi:hypothetical protein